mmetsp:Transcript_129509/g.415149  ORF Transcript_129509/g.415149 Transcript_129509/m.415149 type:complete len:214 (-) Transcript_129509:2800-3441(-)
MGMPTKYSKSLMALAVELLAEPPPCSSVSSVSSSAASSLSASSPSPSASASAFSSSPLTSSNALKPCFLKSATRSKILRRLTTSLPSMMSLMKRALALKTSHSRVNLASNQAFLFSYTVNLSFAKSLMMSRALSYFWMWPSASKRTMLFKESEDLSLKSFSNTPGLSLFSTCGANVSSKLTEFSLWYSAYSSSILLQSFFLSPFGKFSSRNSR